uniref:Smoothelin-like protein 1 n=1 Tax=Geotrypetes seraphini TaxID=260995 RepID=A0A6P8PPR2_GEOSA|nr:smoothelin-like protein 1 [Geotrypetes seraphini]
MDGMAEEKQGEVRSQSLTQEAETAGASEETSQERTQSGLGEKEEGVSGKETQEEAKTAEEVAQTEVAEEAERQEEAEKANEEGKEPTASAATEKKEEESQTVEPEEVAEDKSDAPGTQEEAGVASGTCSATEKETKGEAEEIAQDNEPASSSQDSREDAASSAAEANEGAKETGGAPSDADANGQPAPSGTDTKEHSGPSAATEKATSTEQKKPLERRRDLMRPRTVPKSSGAQSRKAIMEKFGGPVTGAAPGVKLQRSTSGAAGVKNMLLEWCRAKTRGYEHVDIQNFSSSWSSGMAFCALIHKFFPDALDYESLDPKNRRQNFELAFSAAEKHADCPPLLEADDMVRMSVPDSKCVYTYVQELYRSLVQKGLVKTKKQ